VWLTFNSKSHLDDFLITLIKFVKHEMNSSPKISQLCSIGGVLCLFVTDLIAQ
jgi:hypothetical protein